MKSRGTGRVRRRRAGAWRAPQAGAGRIALVAALVAAAAGCKPSIRWHYWWPREEVTAPETNGRLTLVYFRNWYSVECTRFAREVLSQKPVIDATAAMTCIQLEYDVPADRNMARHWGIERVPGLAVLGADGALLETTVGEVSAAELLAVLARARDKAAGVTTRPVAPP